MLISTFELFVKLQLPKELNTSLPHEFQKTKRTIIQGYFLIIANTTSSEVIVSLVFTAVKPSVDIEQTFTFVDVRGVKIPDKFTRKTAPGKVKFTLPIPANDMCLFILQPDILKNNG